MTKAKLIQIQKQAQKRRRLRVVPRFNPNAATKLVGGLVFALLIFQLILSNQLATQGAQISKLSRTLTSLSHEEGRLRTEISALGSLSYIKEEAGSRLSMVEVGDNIDYLPGSQRLASK